MTRPIRIMHRLLERLDLHGRELLAIRPTKKYCHVILCRIPGNHPYVTWSYSDLEGGSGTTSGHYFTEEEYDKALEDFMRRAI